MHSLNASFIMSLSAGNPELTECCKKNLPRGCSFRILNNHPEYTDARQLLLEFEDYSDYFNRPSYLLTDINTLMDLPGGFFPQLKEQIHTRRIIVFVPRHFSPQIYKQFLSDIDFLHYPFTAEEFLSFIKPLQNKTPESIHDKKLDKIISGLSAFHPLSGNSQTLKAIRRQIYKASKEKDTVLFLGETGTGKTEAAKILHKISDVKDGPLFYENIAALNPCNIETSIFGHIKGSFTDAIYDRKGFLDSAQNGSLILDEITELPLELQPKLLRAVEERKYRNVGSDKDRSTNARFIFATNSDIENDVNNNKFRRDLYYRISQIIIDLPALRHHKEDIPLLADKFIQEWSGKHPGCTRKLNTLAIEKLLEFDWPGNVRQLQNVIYRSCLNSDSETICPANIDLR